jgi:thiamine biosynthesis lipoprotein
VIASTGRRWLRRAQPWLGTVVEVGVPAGGKAETALAAAFATIARAQACLSRFDPHSDVARLHALPAGGQMRVHTITREVLVAARELQTASAGLFDISLGSAPDGWRLNDDCLTRLDEQLHIDLGGIGKGHAVDLAVAALTGQGCDAGWVNAGGDLRVFGDVELPIRLRDDAAGGARDFATLRDGAFASSAFGRGCRSQLAGGAAASAAGMARISVAAPRCLWADALTKVVAASGDITHPLLARCGAQAWWH